MNDWYFKGENHAAIYNKSRPSPPKSLIQNIVDCVLEKYYNTSLGKYIPPESKQVYLENYRGDDFMNIPFARDPVRRDESISSENPGTVADIVDFMNSGSAFQNFLRLEGPEKADSLLHEFQKELMGTIGALTAPEQTPVLIQYKYFLIMARKPID